MGRYIHVQCNGVYKNLLTKILSGYFFAETRTSGGYPALVYNMLLNIVTQLELRKATHAAKLELLEATLVTLESYKRCCTVYSPHLESEGFCRGFNDRSIFYHPERDVCDLTYVDDSYLDGEEDEITWATGTIHDRFHCKA